MIRLLKKLFFRKRKTSIITINTKNVETQEAEQLGGDYCSDLC